jgi:hypothetical protein
MNYGKTVKHWSITQHKNFKNTVIEKGINNILGKGKNGYKTVLFLLLRKNNYIHTKRQKERDLYVSTLRAKLFFLNICLLNLQQ